MKSLVVLGLVALCLVGGALALGVLSNPDDRPLRELDSQCPMVQVHSGYSVQQIAVRTSRGIFCQYPSGDSPVVVSKTPILVEESVVSCVNLSRRNVCVEKSFDEETGLWSCSDREDFLQESCGAEEYTFTCTAYKLTSPGVKTRTCEYKLNEQEE